MTARLSTFDGGVGPAVETTALDVVDVRPLCASADLYGGIGAGRGSRDLVTVGVPLDRVGTHLAELASLHRDDIRGGADS
ncbi:hypothetical protein ACIBM3_29320 [Rhodococcus erythropolis]|uniref:hypothetical protein n=1 Tax=Rhodococcus erythropolis TaxID=1833 RepID=UPI00378BCFA3